MSEPITCTMILNEAKNGVELHFNDKPDDDTRTLLRNNRFIFYNKKGKKYWCAKQSEITLALAKKISESYSMTNEIDQTAARETEQSDNTKYIQNVYPDYEEINHIKIYPSSDIKIEHSNTMSGYFADTNTFVNINNTGFHVYELENAMCAGKTVTCYAGWLEASNENSMYQVLVNENQIDTFTKLIAAVRSGCSLQEINTKTSEEKGIEVFSPFVQVTPIKTPSKWTRTHIWKALLTGQIYKAECAYHYTDDYARDADVNFREGQPVDTISLGAELIEHASSSAYIHQPDSYEGKKCVFSYSFHSNHCITLYYDESCDLSEAKRRRKQEQEEREQYNAQYLSHVKTVEELAALPPNKLYAVTYLDMDNNTGRFMERKKITPGYNLLWHDDSADCEEPCEKYIEISEYILEPSLVYQISSFYLRPNWDCRKDERLIDMGNWNTYVSGRVLAEIVKNRDYYIQEVLENTRTIDELLQECQDFITGKRAYLGTGMDTDYVASYEKLLAEQQELEESNVELPAIADQDALTKFESFEVKPIERISQEDKALCELAQSVYDRTFQAYKLWYETYHQLNDSYTPEEKEQLQYTNICVDDLGICDKVAKLQNSFVGKIYSYFQDTYHVELNDKPYYDAKSNWNYDYRSKTIDFVPLHYDEFVEKIIDELGGLSFQELYKKQLREKVHSACYNSGRERWDMAVKNNTIKFDGLLYWQDWYSGYEASELQNFRNMVKAISWFEYGFATWYSQLNVFCNYRVEWNNIEPLIEIDSEKIKSFRLYRNGRVDIKLQKPEFARQFATEWCGYPALEIAS